VVIALGEHPVRRLSFFTAGIFVVSTAGGLVILFALGRTLVARIAHPSAHTQHVLELAIGIVLLVAAGLLWVLRARLRPRLRRAPATLAVLAATVLAVTAAGCGGSTSAEAKWAGDVCSAVTTWKDKVQKAGADVQATLQAPKAGMRATIEADLRTAVAATNTL